MKESCIQGGKGRQDFYIYEKGGEQTMATKAELEEQVAELEEALQEARSIIDTALGIESDDSEEDQE